MLRHRKIYIYLIVFILIAQLFPLYTIAEDEKDTIDRDKVIVFASQTGDDIELFEDETTKKVIVEIPDDTEVELIETGESLSLIHYVSEPDDKEDLNEEVEWTGYINNLHIVPIEKAEDFRNQRLGRGLDFEKYQEEQNETAIDQTKKNINKDQQDDSVSESEKDRQKSEEIKKESKQGAEERTIEKPSEEKQAENKVNQHKESFEKAEPKSFSLSSDKHSPLKGVALLNPTNVYSDPLRDSGVLKTYTQGHMLQFQLYDNEWYSATVYIGGKKHQGFIHKNDVDLLIDPNPLEGYALKQPVAVYEKPSRNSKSLKSYSYNHKLIYRSYSSQWHRATVIIGGKRISGYIHVSDVGDQVDAPAVRGITLKDRTNVYSQTDVNSKLLKSYKKGQILKYSIYNSEWYRATVIIGGKARTGFISKKDVETAVTSQVSIRGVGIKSPTCIYSAASANSKVLKSYKYGSILKYKSFTSGWYEATVYVDGKAQTGYIKAGDAGDIKTKLQGYALTNPVNVYSNPNRNSGKLKSYRAGSVLQYQAHNTSWYKATVYVNGKAQTGYIHNKDVGVEPPILKGYALQGPTHVYGSTSKSPTKLKSYKKGQMLKLRPYNSSWYVVTVYVGGKALTGYIHVNDVSDSPPLLKGYSQLNPTFVYSMPSKKAGKLKVYRIGHLLQYRPYNANWYVATVYVNGKAHTGYIFNKDVGTKVKKISSPTYINGVLIVNKKFPLPSSYAPGESRPAREAFNRMAKAGKKKGYNLVAFSTYRSYSYQNDLFNRYVKKSGVKAANRYSAKPGESEHQTGLAFDVGEIGKEHLWAKGAFEHTNASKWLANNAHKYGFIIRYPKGKEKITGYIYEPWHLRYLGVNLATKVYKSGLTLEEYLGIN